MSRFDGAHVRPEAAVFASGVASMGVEILAGRMVAPVFGSSVFTWGSIIGVFLAALSLGYALGGRYAREYASNEALAILASMSAVSVAIVAIGGDPVIAAFSGLGIPARYASILPVTVLFGPMTFLLGVISPFAAEQSKASSHGSASGRVYAVGTIGSIVGAFGATFVLIPAFPVGEVALILGVPLVAVGIWLGDWSSGSAGAVTLAVLAIGVAGVVVLATPAFAGGGTIYESQTSYSDLRVTEGNGIRTMYIGGAPQSATYIDGREDYVFDYAPYMHIPMLMQEDVERVLFIGGGGFTGPQRYVREYPNVTVDAVEIDPEVVDVAQRYFGLQESPRLRVHVEDGRQFLRQTNHTYDVIVLDAFKTDQVPFHLTTREFMELSRSKLDDDGVLMANIISARSGEGSAFYRAMVKTMADTYPNTYSFPTSSTSALQNIELVATKRQEGFTEADLQARNDRLDIGVELSDELRSYRRARNVPVSDVPLLTDDYAPVDALLDEQVNKRYVVTGWNESRAAG